MTFRLVIKEVAIEQGVLRDVHAEAVHGPPGCGMHTHLSLFEGDRNAFHEPSDPQYQLSKTAGRSSPACCGTRARSPRSPTSG